MKAKNKIRKRGFTLIELIVVLGIMSVCLTVVYPYINNYEQRILGIEMESGINGVIEFINGCKSYARNNDNFEKHSRINIEERKLILYQGTRSIRQYTLPDSVKVRLPYGSIRINLDLTGQINDASTINLYNTSSRTEAITIKVGTGYVSKKK